MAKTLSITETSFRFIVCTPFNTSYVKIMTTNARIMTTKSNHCYFCNHIVTNSEMQSKGKTA